MTPDLQEIRDRLALEIRAWRARGRRALHAPQPDPLAGRLLPSRLTWMACESRARALYAFATALPRTRERAILARGVTAAVIAGALPEAADCRRLANQIRLARREN